MIYLKRDFTTEDLRNIAAGDHPLSDESYHPRPKWQNVLALVLAVVVFLAFLGTCYWMIFGRF